jgi:O-antigen/teichoic acid export membrane protein
MDPQRRIIVNTSAQYVKAVVNILLSLYATRLVLHELNIHDYGIYSLIAGVVGILGYLTNALVVTTQRYLSFYQGSGDFEKVREFFYTSLFIHIALSVLFFAALLLFEGFIIDSSLTLPAERISAAHIVYLATTAMLLISVISSPFKAMLISHENIVFLSIVELADAIMKLFLALLLAIITTDKLEFYAYGMSIVILINLLAYIIYTYRNYEESRYKKNQALISRQSVSQLLGFASWTLYGMVAGVCQTQGTAILLNRFFGTALNAAFGLATQVNGAIRFVSTSIINAMNPQIMKAEGNDNRTRMLELASKESKFSTAMMAIISIPIIVEMPSILDFWLEEIPSSTALLCRAMMIAFLIDQLTLGLHAANQATGKIRNYSILMFTPKILYVPAAWLILYISNSVTAIMALFVIIEFTVALCRIPYLHYTAGLNMSDYFQKTILPVIPLFLVSYASSLAFSYLADFPFRFVFTFAISTIISLLVMWAVVLDNNEKQYIQKQIQMIISRCGR